MDDETHIWHSGRTATLKDVAREVGVSESLVSVVLNGSRSGTRISEATRRRVARAAEELGYRPNALARSLYAGRSNRLGIYSGRANLDARNVFFAEILGGMFEGAREHGMNTVVHTSGDGPCKLLELVSDRAVDGLVVYAEPRDPILPMLSELRIPAVAVADRLESLPSICVDDRAGGILQAEHLAAKGRRHVLIKQSQVPPQSARARVAAFQERAQELGIRTTVHDEMPHEPLGTNDADHAVLLDGPDRATALVGWNDGAAERACRTLTAAGISVPDQVAVVGFDGCEPGYAALFALTTVKAPWVDVGRLAAHTLMSMIRGEGVPMVSVLPVEFVQGMTT